MESGGSSRDRAISGAYITATTNRLATAAAPNARKARAEARQFHATAIAASATGRYKAEYLLDKANPRLRPVHSTQRRPPEIRYSSHSVHVVKMN